MQDSHACCVQASPACHTLKGRETREWYTGVTEPHKGKDVCSERACQRAAGCWSRPKHVRVRHDVLARRLGTRHDISSRHRGRECGFGPVRLHLFRLPRSWTSTRPIALATTFADVIGGVDWNNSIYLQASGAFKPLEAIKAIDMMIVLGAQADPKFLKAAAYAHHKAIGSLSGAAIHASGSVTSC